MRNLDPARAKREREIDHLADPVDVGTVHHRIHGERELCVARPRPRVLVS
jgi:hypothetical protein